MILKETLNHSRVLLRAAAGVALLDCSSQYSAAQHALSGAALLGQKRARTVQRFLKRVRTLTSPIPNCNHATAGPMLLASHHGTGTSMVNDGLQQWIGRTETVDDHITAAPARALAATLDRNTVPGTPGDALPPLWHWLYFLATPATQALGPDGHAERGGFLPAVDLPRRMWAGSRLQFHQPLRLGEGVRRISRISDIAEKQGRSGELVIVTVTHTYQGKGGLAITEEQDIVYREAAPPAATGDRPPPAPPGQPDWSRTVTPDPVLLFRYSALTFNSHRIHYDHPYATEVEGYPGLVVHGPLTLTLLVEALAAAHPLRNIASLSMRALQPLFHGAPFHAQGRLADDGRQATLWSVDEDGGMSMEASAELAD